MDQIAKVWVNPAHIGDLNSISIRAAKKPGDPLSFIIQDHVFPNREDGTPERVVNLGYMSDSDLWEIAEAINGYLIRKNGES